jgi:hypothetical protein
MNFDLRNLRVMKQASIIPLLKFESAAVTLKVVTIKNLASEKNCYQLAVFVLVNWGFVQFNNY